MSNLIFLLELNPLVDWIINIFRSLFAFFDMIFYSLITLLFRAVFNLANFELYGFYELFENRIYVILGIFMLFKVTVSMITYLVNPDKMADKEQGAAKLVTRIITVLVMLIALPTFFGLMTEAQNKLLPVIPRVITGYAVELKSDDVTGVSENMTMTLLRNFSSVKNECGGEDANEINTPSDLLNHVNDKCEGNDSIYKYDYFPVLSTLIGLIGCYVIFSLCISVAIRAFKLIILRMIAPIPVISYIDPKSAKDGAFSHWTKTFISTWAELFINLAIIYFIVYMIDMLTVDSTWATYFDKNITPLDQGLLLAFLIIGLLFFAKQAPKFIFDALGIKYKGNFTRMLGMGATALSGIGGAVGATAAAIKKSDKTPFQLMSAVSRGLFSGAGAMAAGGDALLGTDKPAFSTGMDATKKYQAKNMMNIRAGYGMGQKLLSGAKSMFGYDIDAEINNTQAIVDTSKRLKEYTMGEGAKYYSDEYLKLSAGGHNFSMYTRNDLLTEVSRARATGSDVQLLSDDGQLISFGVDSSYINQLTGDADEAVGTLYMDAVDTIQANGKTAFENKTGKTDSGALKAFRTSYANATGIDDDVVETHRISEIKKNQKSNETKVFNLKQEKGPNK